MAITGSTGLIGRRVTALLQADGHHVFGLQRPKSMAPSVASSTAATWDPSTGQIVTPSPINVLIHLAGRNVATRWTVRAKREIRDSRVAATEKLCTFLASLPIDQRPQRLISASAVGIYGSRGDEVLTEDSTPAAPGSSFLADVCLGWEAATRPAADAGIRVSHLRIGVVLAKEGGALAKLATPTKLGLAGPVGPGSQFIPWISLTDISRLIVHLALSEAPPPVVNGVSPAPERQRHFIRNLANLLHRPAVFPLPSFMVKLAFGQMGAETLLASLRVIPAKIPAEFTFAHSSLEQAICAELRLPV